MLPCNSIRTEAGLIEGEKGKVSEECDTSKERQEKYIGASNIIMYVNQVHFEQSEYGSKSIERYSSLINHQFDTSKPSWLTTLVQFNELQDESGFLQLGYDDTTEYLAFKKDDSNSSAWQ